MSITLASKLTGVSRQIFDTLIADSDNVLDDIKRALEGDGELKNIIENSSNFNISLGVDLRKKISFYNEFPESGKEILGSLKSWDTSRVTDMSGVFLGSSINESLSNWDTSRVTTMACMFKNSENFNQDISSWDVSSVIDFSDMFYGVTTLSNTNRAKIHNSLSLIHI